MTTIHIIAGPPSSGKTSYYKALRSYRPKYSYLSADELFAALASSVGNRPVIDFERSFIDAILSQLRRHPEHLVLDGLSQTEEFEEIHTDRFFSPYHISSFVAYLKDALRHYKMPQCAFAVHYIHNPLKILEVFNKNRKIYPPHDEKLIASYSYIKRPTLIFPIFYVDYTTDSQMLFPDDEFNAAFAAFEASIADHIENGIAKDAALEAKILALPHVEKEIYIVLDPLNAEPNAADTISAACPSAIVLGPTANEIDIKGELVNIHKSLKMQNDNIVNYNIYICRLSGEMPHRDNFGFGGLKIILL